MGTPWDITRINLKPCSNCSAGWYGLSSKKKRHPESKEWLFWIECVCGIRTAKYRILDQAKLDWNNDVFM